ncbi:MAG: TetR/AcrR family transcriptional regulator [Lachnospiraceae bacterium]|nr:TetR/AcrR family transcriptional regulator [Lachnospiraceae bacterium]
MDRRQRKTRSAIFDAFTKLLSEKSYSNITVQEIIDEADISRSTFYSHFETKDELLREMSNDIFAHVFSDHPAKEKSHDFSRADYDLKEEITHILYHLQDNSRYLSRILSCESGEMFMRYFKEYLEKIFRDELKKIKTDIPTEYLLNHMVCDFAETVRWWMKNDKFSPEDISRFFFSATPFD